VFPTFILKIAPYVAGLRILVATLPNGDIERTRLIEAGDGMRVRIERQPARSDIATWRELRIPRGRYSWRIEEERRTVIMSVPGRPTGVVNRAFVVILNVDRRDPRSIMPNPVEAYRLYAPTREAAEALRERLKRALEPVG
jgi:hypothetical protein